MSALYLVLAVMTLGWGLLHQSKVDITQGSVVEVDSFDDVLDNAVIVEETDVTLIILLVLFVISILGILFSLLVIIGVLQKSPCFLLPWLIFHVFIILLCICVGIYILIHFLVLTEERQVDMALLSVGPILIGIFLIFLWILVDQLFVKLRHIQLVIEVKSPGSETRTQETFIEDSKSNRSSSLRSWGKPRHLQNRSSNDARMSRSLENIIDSQSDSSTSSYQSEIISQKLPGITTLPRLRRCKDNPDTFRGYSNWKSGNTDTIKSIKSVTSSKSVFIHPEVTEYHYRDSVAIANDVEDEQEADLVIDFSDETDNEIYTNKIGQNISKANLDENRSRTNKFKPVGSRKGLTKEQIIGIYCSNENICD